MGPVITPNVSCCVTVTANVLIGLVPQALLADTVIFPPVDPTVTVMLLNVDVPLHVPGIVHV